ncbi:MAG: response regulator [Burkholderiales bacterium]|nr:response regulator [Burkholderiales bacterium]
MKDKAIILAIDDQPDNLLILEELLSDRYTVHGVGDGQAALAFLDGRGPVDLILLDVMMPGLNGYQVCERLKADPATRHIPVIFLTSLDSAADEERALRLGAEDFMHKPFSPPVVMARVANHLKLSRFTALLRERNDDLERIVAERTREIRRQADELLRREELLAAAQDSTIRAFCSLAEARDNETGNHIRRTQHYVKALALRLRDHPRFRAHLTEDTVELLFKSAPLHDVGKVAIPDAILLKPGKLGPDEWEIMKQHAEYGRAAIASAELEMGPAHRSYLRHAREIAHGHHERWNGTGYPQGLAGEAIPVSARLMAVADVYDALISRRVYKPALTHQTAISMMAQERGAHFDPDVVDALLAIRDEFHDIARRYCDDERSRDGATPALGASARG